MIMTVIGSKSKFEFLKIKLKEAESNISLALQTKKNILERMIKVIKDQKKYKDDFEDFHESFLIVKDTFALHDTASKYYMKISKIIFDDECLAKKEKIIELLNELKNNEENLIGSIKFYNDTVVDFNGLLKSFPHKVIGKILGYKENQFYSNEKEELFEILK